MGGGEHFCMLAGKLLSIGYEVPELAIGLGQNVGDILTKEVKGIQTVLDNDLSRKMWVIES